MIKELPKEFTVLGSKVVINKDDSGVDPQEVVNKVTKEAEKLQALRPDLSHQAVATLVALKIASESLVLEKEYKMNIEKLENSVSEALNFVDELLPEDDEKVSS